MSGHSRSITCSRWRRWPRARASNFTRVAAFLSRQASPTMVCGPTETLEAAQQPDPHRHLARHAISTGGRIHPVPYYIVLPILLQCESVEP